MKKVVLFSLALVTLFLTPSYSQAKELEKMQLSFVKKKTKVSKTLIGSWVGQTDQGQVSLIFKDATTLVFDGEENAYTADAKAIKVDSEEGVIAYPYILNGNTLTVTFPEGFEIKFQRVGTNSQTTSKNASNSKLNYLLQGNFCSYSSSSTYSSSYSSSSKVYFDGNGKFSYGGGETSSSGNAGSYYGNSGASNIGSYNIIGTTIHLTDANGEKDTAQVHYRSSDGLINEVMYHGKLYGKALCN